MEELEAVIRNVVESSFSGASVEFDHDPNYAKVIGTVVWDNFEGVRQSERQGALWGAMRRDLSDEQLSSIGLLMTVTHAELASILGEAA